MKLITILSIPILYVFSFIMWAQPVKTTNDVRPFATELTDKKGVAFAWNLRDWKNKRIDSLYLDLYYPTGAVSTKKYPLLMFYHAGGFSAGNRFNVMTICDAFADEGFIAVGIDYRTGYDKGKSKDCTSDSITLNNAIHRAVQDANAAIRFMVANADKYNVDTNWIFIAGSSAGGTLSYAQAYWSDSTQQLFRGNTFNVLGSLNTSGNSFPANYSIKGMCAMWGTLGQAPLLIDAKYRNIPTIMFKGEEDGGAPDSAGNYDNCINMPYVYAGPGIYTEYVKEKIPIVYHYLPAASHPAYDNGFCVQNASCFFHTLMNGGKYTGEYLNFKSSCP